MNLEFIKTLADPFARAVYPGIITQTTIESGLNTENGMGKYIIQFLDGTERTIYWVTGDDIISELDKE